MGTLGLKYILLGLQGKNFQGPALRSFLASTSQERKANSGENRYPGTAPIFEARLWGGWYDGQERIPSAPGNVDLRENLKNGSVHLADKGKDTDRIPCLCMRVPSPTTAISYIDSTLQTSANPKVQ